MLRPGRPEWANGQMGKASPASLEWKALSFLAFFSFLVLSCLIFFFSFFFFSVPEVPVFLQGVRGSFFFRGTFEVQVGR